jgi:hypothetical protein
VGFRRWAVFLDFLTFAALLSLYCLCCALRFQTCLILLFFCYCCMCLVSKSFSGGDIGFPRRSPVWTCATQQLTLAIAGLCESWQVSKVLPGSLQRPMRKARSLEREVPKKFLGMRQQGLTARSRSAAATQTRPFSLQCGKQLLECDSSRTEE